MKTTTKLVRGMGWGGQRVEAAWLEACEAWTQAELARDREKQTKRGR